MSKEHCCCGSIHTGALIISYLVLIFGTIGLLASVVAGNGPGIVSNALSIIIGGCIGYADHSHKPGGYLPYLICAAISIFIYTVSIVLFVIKAIAEPWTLSYYTEDFGYGDRYIDPGKLYGFLFMTAVLALADWIAIWFWMVVYRAYQHMKGVEE
uniref:Uncharacterized protein n=1 Tax=Acrobeloides nanus TaxID=290746 RepID=A0A914ELD0_9BILA